MDDIRATTNGTKYQEVSGSRMRFQPYLKKRIMPGKAGRPVKPG